MLREKLIAGGAAEVNDVSIYETRVAASLPQSLLGSLEKHELNWITFTGSSTAKNLADLLGSDYRAKLAGVKLASIGPITSKTLREAWAGADGRGKDIQCGRIGGGDSSRQ